MSEKAFRVCVVTLLAVIAVQLGASDAATERAMAAWAYIKSIGKPKEEPLAAPTSQRGGILDSRADEMQKAAQETPIITPKP